MRQRSSRYPPVQAPDAGPPSLERDRLRRASVNAVRLAPARPRADRHRSTAFVRRPLAVRPLVASCRRGRCRATDIPAWCRLRSQELVSDLAVLAAGLGERHLDGPGRVGGAEPSPSSSTDLDRCPGLSDGCAVGVGRQPVVGRGSIDLHGWPFGWSMVAWPECVSLWCGGARSHAVGRGSLRCGGADLLSACGGACAMGAHVRGEATDGGHACGWG